MYSTFQAGQLYINTFPRQKKLNLFMPDYRLIRLVNFASKAMPAFACFLFVWQQCVFQSDQAITANAVLTALFALSIPFQGLWWLGRRAKSPLPLSLLDWYQSLYQKLLRENQKITHQAMPSYQDFAELLKLAEKIWGQQYFDEL